MLPVQAVVRKPVSGFKMTLYILSSKFFIIFSVGPKHLRFLKIKTTKIKRHRGAGGLGWW